MQWRHTEKDLCWSADMKAMLAMGGADEHSARLLSKHVCSSSSTAVNQELTVSVYGM